MLLHISMIFLPIHPHLKVKERRHSLLTIPSDPLIILFVHCSRTSAIWMYQYFRLIKIKVGHNERAHERWMKRSIKSVRCGENKRPEWRMSPSRLGTGRLYTYTIPRCPPGNTLFGDIDALWDVITTSHASAMTPTKVSVSVHHSLVYLQRQAALDVHTRNAPATKSLWNLNREMRYRWGICNTWKSLHFHYLLLSYYDGVLKSFRRVCMYYICYLYTI